MRAIRHRVRVLEDGRLEVSDPALEAGLEAEVVVLLPEPTGDGATTPAPLENWTPPDDDLSATAPSNPDRRRFTLVDLIGLAPSGRTAEEIDREIRDFRGTEDDESQ